MVEIKSVWTEENLKEYARYNTFSKGVFSRFMVIALIALYAVVVVGCLILYFMTELVFALIMPVIFTLFLVGCFLFLVSTMKEFVKNALKTGENEDFDSVLIDTDNIFICKEQQPIGQLDWDKITKIGINEKAGAVYLSTEENAVLILEFKNIVKGTEKELRETVKEKYDKLSKKT